MNYRLLLLISILYSVLACKKEKLELQPAKGLVRSVQLDAFTKVQFGTMPLVISVPHGGTLTPDTLPDRTCPNITTAVDIYTIEMATAIDSVAKADYGFQPYLVTTNLRRIKLDQNRALAEATCSNPFMYNYWYNFHNALDTCLQKVLQHYSQCIFIDLHAHGHTIQRLELGYLVTKTELQNLPTVSGSGTSLSNLFSVNPTLTVSQAITGANSFGTLIYNEGYPAVPSTAIPAPAMTEPYFDGGYNTARYTAYSKTIGWQIESNYTGVRENRAQRTAFAKAFLRSLLKFYRANTNMNPENFGY